MTWKQEEELARAVCSGFEPDPPTVTANEARKLTSGFVWVSCHDFHSPGGWWVAEIGTDHGDESEDDSPVRWRPAIDLERIEDVWRVVEAMKDRGWLCHVLAMIGGWVVNARRYDLGGGRTWENPAMTSDFVQEIGDEVGEAVYKAAAAALALTTKGAPHAGR